jgi:putative hydrolase of HD superfamily
MTESELLDCMAKLDPLGDLPRTGWVIRGLVPAESLAAHSFAVTTLVALLRDAVRADGMEVDGEQALRMALVHDAPEAKTGDIPMPHKTSELVAALEVLEAKLAAEILPPRLFADWRAHSGTSLEAQLVIAADKLQMLIKLHLLTVAGRAQGPAFESMWKNPANVRNLHIPAVRRVYEALFARAGRPLPGPV